MPLTVTPCTHLSQQTIQSLPALVMLGVEPYHPNNGQQTRNKGRNAFRLSVHQLLTGVTQQRDELEAILSFLVTFLQNNKIMTANTNKVSQKRVESRIVKP